MVRRNEGKILNTASIASLSPHPLLNVYAATKAFVLSFTEALRNELQDTNVTVTALMPGATDTDFFRKAHAEHTKAANSDLADPAEVPRDGYKALMHGDDKVITPKSYRKQAKMMSVMDEEKKAAKSRQQMEPADESDYNGKATSPFLLATAITGLFVGLLFLLGFSDRE